MSGLTRASRGSLLAPSLLALGLLGAALGGALRTGTSTPPAPAPPVGVSATVAVIGFLDSPTRAVLEVTLFNRSEQDVVLEQVAALVEGGTATTRHVGTPVPAGQLARASTEAELPCPSLGDLQVRLTLLAPTTPAVATGANGPASATTLLATPTGELSGGDLCASAAMAVASAAQPGQPDQADRPAPAARSRVVRAAYQRTTAAVRAADLPPGEVLAAWAGPWQLLGTTTPVRSDGTADLVLDGTRVRCGALTGGQPVPTTLTLSVKPASTGSGRTDDATTAGAARRSLPLGPDLARWLLASASGCPTAPSRILPHRA